MAKCQLAVVPLCQKSGCPTPESNSQSFDVVGITFLPLLFTHSQIKSEDLVRAYIARAQAVQPVLNAIVHDNFDAALKQAQQADQQLDQMTPDQRAQANSN